MADSFAIVCDSTADFGPQWYKAYNVNVVPLKLHVPKGVYSDGLDITPDQVYGLLARGIDVRASQPSVAEFHDLFTRLYKEGYRQCACVCSSKVAAITQSNARLAAKSVRTKFAMNVEIIDSLSVSAAEGMVVCDITRNRAKGMSFGDSIAHAQRLARHIATLMVVPPGQATSLLLEGFGWETIKSGMDSMLGRWALAAFDARGLPQVVARSRDPQQLADIAASLTAVDREREGPLAHATFSTGQSELERALVDSVSVMLPLEHDLGHVEASGAVAVWVGLGAVGLVYAPERYCVIDAGLPLFTLRPEMLAV